LVPGKPQKLETADGPAEAGPRPLVLIVDDNADLRDYLRQCLQAEYRSAAGCRIANRPGFAPSRPARPGAERPDDARDGSSCAAV
jgi:hypothetical protein